MTHRPSRAPLTVAPVGAWDRLAIVALGSAGCALSYDALQQMAVAIHIRGLLTYLFPLVIDGFIAYGVRALLVLSAAPLRARLYVWTLFGIATSASIWANALHAVRLNQQTSHTGLRLGDTVVAILSTLAPLALAGAVHLYILITRHHPTDHARTNSPADQPQTTLGKRTSNSTADQTGNAEGTTGEIGADQSWLAGPPSSHAADQRTTTGADHGPASADPRTNTSPLPAAHEARTSNTAAQTAHVPPGFKGDGSKDQAWGAESESDPDQLSTDGPTDQTAARVQERPANSRTGPADQRAGDGDADQDTVVPGARTAPGADHTTQGPDQPTGHDSKGLRREQSADHAATPVVPRTPDADQTAGDGDEVVPWEQIVEVARLAALEEGRLTRRAIRPHLRKRGIRVSNEAFSELQTHLYADQTLAHLPHSTKKAR